MSQAWRTLGQSMFFSKPWEVPHLICHPSQLFCLVRRAAGGGGARERSRVNFFPLPPRLAGSPRGPCAPKHKHTQTLPHTKAPAPAPTPAPPRAQSPRPVASSRTGLLKCFVRRSNNPPGRGLRRFNLYVGKDPGQPHRARFLLAALQASARGVL